MAFVVGTKVGRVSIPRQRKSSESLRRICSEEYDKPEPSTAFYMAESELIFRGLLNGLAIALVLDTLLIYLVIYFWF